MQKIDGTTILLNRGDNLTLNLTLAVDADTNYTFQPGDKIKFSVYNKKQLDKQPVLEEEVVVNEATETVIISCSGEETKIGDYINKPVDYWYEITLNDYNTVLGYDEQGAKILKLFPEGYNE